MKPNFVLFAAVITFLCNTGNLVWSLNNGLALTPPMGWMSWERFRCTVDCDTFPDTCISEKLILRMTDLMVSEGYKDAGYEYVIIDDCWLEPKRNKTGFLVPDRKRFPNGMKYVADYIHSKGLKFGLYEDYGTKTCAGYPGIINHMQQDAQTFADWDVDYVKLDGCYADINDMDFGYPLFGKLLNRTGRPMVYSCSWPAYQEPEGVIPNYEALKKHCNLWRNWDDIEDSWSSMIGITDYFAINQLRIQPHGGVGHWNDPDMLLIGNAGLTFNQAKVQFALWAILAAPLLMSNDLKSVAPAFKEILQNKEVIQINQDPLGIQGLRVSYSLGIEMWTRPIVPIKNGQYSYAVAFVSHLTNSSTIIFVNVKTLGLNNPKGYSAYDLYDPNSIAPFATVKPETKLQIDIEPMSVMFYKFVVN